MSDFIPFFLIPFMAWGVRRYKRKQDDFGALKRSSFYIGVSAFFITEMVRSFYRPFIYTHDIYDFHFADTIGNSAGTVAAIFMILTMTHTGITKERNLFFLVFLGLIVYEIVGGVGGNPFDVWDLAATIIFSLLSAIVYFGILKPKFKDIIETKGSPTLAATDVINGQREK